VNWISRLRGVELNDQNTKLQDNAITTKSQVTVIDKSYDFDICKG
jgi:hypothetical protein